MEEGPRADEHPLEPRLTTQVRYVQPDVHVGGLAPVENPTKRERWAALADPMLLRGPSQPTRPGSAHLVNTAWVSNSSSELQSTWIARPESKSAIVGLH